MEGGISLSDGTSEQNSLSVGSFISRCLTVKLYNFDGRLAESQFEGSTVSLKVGLVMEDATEDSAEKVEWVYPGTFYTGEHSESGGIITLTAYDKSVKFDRKYDSTLQYPATLYQILWDACKNCGVELANVYFANMDYIVASSPSDSATTYANIVSYVAQLAGCWARINSQGQLVLGWYDTDEFYPDSGDIVDGNDELTASGNSVNFDAYPNTAIRSLTCTGNTMQDGTGDPSPDNVRQIHGTAKVAVNSVGYTLPQELFSLPDGTVDSYDAVAGKGTQKVGKIVLDGSQTVNYETAYTNTAKFTFVTSNIGPASPIIADKFETINNSNSDVGHIATWAGWTGINIFIPKSRLAGWNDGWTDAQKVTAFKSWLSANPVTVLYELATPRAITGTPQTITASANTTVTAENGGQANVTYSGSYVMDGGNFYPEGEAVDGGTLLDCPEGNSADGGSFSDYSQAEMLNGGDFFDYGRQTEDAVTGGVFRQELSTPVTISSLASCTAPTEDVRITGVAIIPKDDKAAPVMQGADDYVISIKDNPLAQGSLGRLLDGIAKQLVDFQFRPMEVSAWDNPSIEAGDVAYLTDPKGNRYKTIISNLTYEFGNYEEFSADAESKSDNQASLHSNSEKSTAALRADTGKAIDETNGKVDSLASNTAASVSSINSNINLLQANKVDTDFLQANYLTAKDIKADYATVNSLTAATARISTLEANSVTTDYLKTNYMAANDIKSTYATVENLNAANARIDSITASTVTAEYLKAHYADINLANIASGTIKTAMIDTGAVGTAQIADGSITDAKIVELTADKITAGTLSVERLVITGSDKSIVYAINDANGTAQLSQTTVDGGSLTQRSITADRIVAGAVTAKEIASGTITADKLAAGTITAASGVIGSIDASKITTGTINADRIDTTNLKAQKIYNDALDFSVVIGSTTIKVYDTTINGSGVKLYNGSTSIGSLCTTKKTITDIGDVNCIYLTPNDNESYIALYSNSSSGYGAELFMNTVGSNKNYGVASLQMYTGLSSGDSGHIYLMAGTAGASSPTNIVEISGDGTRLNGAGLYQPYTYYSSGKDNNNEYTSYYTDYGNGMRHAWGSYQRHDISINSAYYGVFQGTEFFYMHNAPFSEITTIQVTPNSSGDVPVVNATVYSANNTGLSVRFISPVSLSNFTIRIYYDVWGKAA